MPKVSPQTASRNLNQHGVPAKWRRPRTKPLRHTFAEAERLEICDPWRRYPASYFTQHVDLIIDNRYFAIPTLTRATQFQKMRRAHGHLRTPSEGDSKGFTKPCQKRHRQNPGSLINVCAGIIGGRVRLWHYLQKVWNCEVAAQTYRGPIHRTLKIYCGGKPT